MRLGSWITLCLLLAGSHRSVGAEPLPSWRDGAVKTAIIDYLAAIVDRSGPDFIPEPERIAVLDNDGTSWCERPRSVPTRFQVALLGSLARAGRVDSTEMPYRAWLTDDRGALREFGWNEAYRAMNATFAGMPVDAFADSARAFLARSRHPRFGVPLTDLYYAPMLELMRLLEAHAFQVWIVTGGEQGFARSYLHQVAGIPPERVIGSWTVPVYDRDGDQVTLLRGNEQVYNGHEHKPAHIFARIGRRPVFAAGNSNNDEPMCRYTLTGERRSMAIWIHHDDAEREYASDRGAERIADLCAEHPAAYEVSMRRDWQRIFRQ